MARLTSVAAVIAVLLLPGLAALAGFVLVPDSPPPNVPAVVRIGESPPAPTSVVPQAPSTTTSAPLPPPPPVDDGDDDGDDDDDG
jgi:hypothetical protein